MDDMTTLKVFLATVRVCVDEFNARHEESTGIRYEVVGWEHERGSTGRAQETINRLIAASDFMIVLFKNSWGSNPGSPWGYTSGTEEELFTGLLELGQAEQPMRDLWVGFVSGSNPDPRITSLRQRIINQHTLMFESILDLGDLKAKLRPRLEAWATVTSVKQPRHVNLIPSSGKDVLQAAKLRIEGEKLIELGHSDLGRASLKEAAAIGGPSEHLAYARSLRHARDLDAAYAETDRAIKFFVDGQGLYSTAAADAFSAQAKVLKEQGEHYKAIGRLSHALDLVDGDDGYAQAVRSRIYDDLGLLHQKVNDLSKARDNFEEALRIRASSDSSTGRCQSQINLARLEVADGNVERAYELATAAIEALSNVPPTRLHANARVLMAQLHLRQGKPAEGIPHAEWALEINREIANKKGEAIALLLLTQCCRAAGRFTDAADYAQACLDLNESIGDIAGAAKAKWQLDQLPDQRS